MLEESDTAIAIKEIKKADPSFTLEGFMKDAREYIIPEIIEAIINKDLQSLRRWCSEAVPFACSLLTRSLTLSQLAMKRPLETACCSVEMCLTSGTWRYHLVSSSQMVMAKTIEEHPIVVLSFNAQQTACTVDAEGKLVGGHEDRIESISYVIALSRAGNDPTTKGWRLAEITFRDSKGAW